MIPTHTFRRGAAALLLALAAVACSDHGVEPLAPAEPPVPAPAVPAGLARVECHVNVRARQISCDEAAIASDARGSIIGGQGQYMKLTSSNVVSVADTLGFDLTVRNLIPQPMGTADGVTPHPDGVRVFVHSGPTVTSGSGSVSAVRTDGTLAFTAPGQPYWQFSGNLLGADGILSQYEVSPVKPAGFYVQPTVISFSFTLYVSTTLQYPNGWVEIAQGATLSEGGTTALTAVVYTGMGEVVASPGPVGWSSSNPNVATVDAASGVVTGVAPGTATITATNGSRTGTLSLRVCALPAAGGVYLHDMAVGSSFCLGGGGATANEYTVVPVNLGTSPLALSVTSGGIVPASGAPSPARLPGAGPVAAWRGSAREADGVAEARLRGRELRQVSRLADGARRFARPGGTAPRMVLVPGTPLVGDLMRINVATANACSGADERTGRVAVVGSHVVILADTMNPSGGLSTADYTEVANRFDTLVWPTLTAAFGTPHDLDGNGRVVVFYTRAVNQLTATGAAMTPGFTLRRDLFSPAGCATSNVGELIYMMAADPSGTINGNVRTVAQVKALAAPTLGHELQHLVNASRRVDVSAPFEETWLDEGLSSVAEELLFYAAASLSPRSNVGYTEVNATAAARAAFIAYAEPNYARLREWLRVPHGSGLFQADDDAATRGAAWAFLRYAADRKVASGSQNAFWSALVGSTTAGKANLQAALGTAEEVDAWLRDFTAAMYADDAVTGAAVRYTQPSWNFRALYNTLDYDGDHLADGYPLAPRNPTSGAVATYTLAEGGGAAFVRMGTYGGALVTFASGGAAPPSTLRIAVIRRK